jgi:hypothetical protein
MALTATTAVVTLNDLDPKINSTYVLLAEFAGDDSYPTGGYGDATAFIRSLYAKAGYPAGQLEILEVVDQTDFAEAVRITWDRSTDKLVSIGWNGTQTSNATDLSEKTFRIKCEAR